MLGTLLDRYDQHLRRQRFPPRVAAGRPERRLSRWPRHLPLCAPSPTRYPRHVRLVPN